MENFSKVHEDVVKGISYQLKLSSSQNQPVHIFKGGVSHFVPMPGDQRRKGNRIDISSLRGILKIDPKERICVAEPGVTFAEVVRATLEHGLIPTVVPELEGITLGGAVAGCSVESMSYRYGGFHDSCIEYEMVTGAGEILRCSREKDPESFEMIHGSYGTLGILTQLTFKLVPAKAYVKMEYRHYERFEEFERVMYELCRDRSAGAYDFIDAIIHEKNHLVLCLGRFVDKVPFVSSYRSTQIFYKSTGERKEDYLTTFDYCFRYDTECHWMSRTVPPLEWKPVRWLLGRYFLGSTNMIQWSKRLEKVIGLKKRPDVVCDVFIPQNRFRAFFDWYIDAFDFFPLWIVPYRVEKMYDWVSAEHQVRMNRQMPDSLMIDCAVYGKPNGEESVDYSDLLEKKTFALDGLKTLISQNHYTQDEFWQTYNRENYTEAKKRMDPKGLFPGVYEKFHR